MFISSTIQSTVAGIPIHAGSSWMPTNGNVKRSTQIPNATGITAATSCPAELLPPEEPAGVVERADHRRDRGAEEEPAHLLLDREERERRDEDPEEEREPAEPRDRQPVDAPPLGRVDGADQARHPARRRRQQQHEHEGEAEAPQHLRGLPELSPHDAYFVP